MCHKSQATGHEPQAALSDSPDEAAFAAEIQGPCRASRQGDVDAILPVTCYGLRTVLLPSPRTTYYVPRTYKADTQVRPYGGVAAEQRFVAPAKLKTVIPAKRASRLARASPDRRGLRCWLM